MSAAAARRAGELPYRMKDLCELTGLSRQAIHFYVQQGLLPPGHKTGRNMAYYGEEHLERLRLIQQLQHERFLPLKAIKAILDGETEQFAPDQRQLLREVKQRIGASLGSRDRGRVADALAIAERCGVTADELERLAELGLLALAREGDSLLVSEQDAWVIEHWGQLRAAGFTAELGFGVDDLELYESMVSNLFDRERALLLERVSHLPADDVAVMIEKVLPLIHSFLARYHGAKVRDFFAAMD